LARTKEKAKPTIESFGEFSVPVYVGEFAVPVYVGEFAVPVYDMYHTVYTSKSSLVGKDKNGPFSATQTINPIVKASSL